MKYVSVKFKWKTKKKTIDIFDYINIFLFFLIEKKNMNIAALKTNE